MKEGWGLTVGLRYKSTSVIVYEYIQYIYIYIRVYIYLYLYSTHATQASSTKVEMPQRGTTEREGSSCFPAVGPACCTCCVIHCDAVLY